MPQRFVTADRDQVFLLPPDMREWLEPDDLAYFVIDAVKAMDLGEFVGVHRADGQGRPAYDPQLLVALLLYAYCVGVRSSRQIERACGRDVAFRVIAGGHRPDHATVARFRARHEDALAGLFTAVLRLCAQVGIVRPQLATVDGTKLIADASGAANHDAAWLENQVRRYFDAAAQADAAEDALFGDARGDELPAELADPVGRPARIREALEQLRAKDAARVAEQERRKTQYQQAVAAGRRPSGRPPGDVPPPSTRPSRKANVTDPDSRVMRTPTRFVQGYNAQLVVSDGQIILAADVTQCAADLPSLHPMLNQANDQLAAAGITGRVRVALADAGYASTENFTTPGPHLLVALPPPPKKKTRTRDYQAMADRLAKPPASRLYRRRKAIVEPVFGQIVNRVGRRASRRGLAAVRTEWQLIATSHNLLKAFRAAQLVAG